MKLTRLLLTTLALMLALSTRIASWAGGCDDDEKQLYHESVRPGVRRLHPERERAKAIKRLQEQMSRPAEPKTDPWDTEGEEWGSVDLPPVAARDSVAVAGYRVTNRRTPDEQAQIEALLTADYSIKEYGMGIRRMTWHDEPVTANIDDLLPCMAVDGGEVRPKNVSLEQPSNEVYFAFSFNDSVPGPLRLCVRYCADDPLGIDEAVFSVDGYDYAFYPAKPQCGVTDGNLYWEVSDDVLRTAHRDMIYALAHSHWIFVKLRGAGGIAHVKMLTDGQRDDFARTLALYRLLGGIVQ